MSSLRIIGLCLFLITGAGCTIEFIPDPDEITEHLVVEGMITDQNRINRIKLSRSLPIGESLLKRKAVKGAIVTITDEKGIVTTLTESPPGTYFTDSTEFRGRVGGSYSLNIKIQDVDYETDFIKMKPVPPISSLYYEKVALNSSRDSSELEEGCRIYIDSYDPSGECLFFRWDYAETWEYRIPFNVTNKICYISERSDEILIKNTSQYSQTRVSKYPVLFISNKTDRLNETYSILVNQYSLTEMEYAFWESVQNISENVGNLYDITPVAVPGNIRCCNDPEEIVLGYFSVSAVTQERLFIHDRFLGLPALFLFCATDTLTGFLPKTGLNTEYWVIEDFGDEPVPFWVISSNKECADCTTRGTTVKPPFWNEFR
jgi:hypothetical protein